MGLIENETLKKNWGNEKNNPWAETGTFAFMCVWEKKCNSLEIIAIIFKAWDMQISYSKRVFKMQNFSPKHPLPYTLEFFENMVKEKFNEDV